MIYFNNDYSEGCHEKVLERLIATNMEQTLGYGEDEYCSAAAAYAYSSFSGHALL